MPCKIWAVDTEWGFRDNRVDHESAWEPVVLCLVGVASGRRLSFWGQDPGLTTFFRDHAADLFVAHYSVAEMKYLLRLGIPLPARWFDTFVGWRYLTNRPNHLEAGLSPALDRLAMSHLAPAVKKALQQRILHMRFDPDSSADRLEITDYCFSDCEGCPGLFRRIGDRVPSAVMAHWAEYLKAVARMEIRGIPFDVRAFQRIAAQRYQIKAALIGDVNATCRVFDGETFSRTAFLQWCDTARIHWPTRISPRTGKRYRPVDRDTMKETEGRHPFIAQVREVLKTLKQFEGRALTVDPITKRHFYSTSVFRSVTGRNQPRNFVFNGPKWLRFLITPESTDHVLVYVDYVAQEIGVAAALSGDRMLRAVYEAPDCHMEFAVRAGAAPTGATKRTHANVRRLFKSVNLGVQYGQTPYGIAERLGVSHREAEALFADHRTLFPDFWRWSGSIVQAAYDRGQIHTPCGWQSLVPFDSKERTWMNWPMQATGRDIMRLTVIYLDKQNVRILAPIHDGFLLSCRRDQLADLRAAVDYACATAVDHVLPGFPLRWDVTVHEFGRFEDEDGRSLWERLQNIVEAT
jgi:DNA polymerase I